MKRFYKQVSVEQGGDAWRILLDGRVIKTPAKAELCAPTKQMAEAVASEWSSQGDTVDIQSMHLTRLINVAIDRTPAQREGMVDEVVKYCETDLLCFLAETPEDLRSVQIDQWRPIREWAGKSLDVVLMEVPDGLLAAPQPPASLQAARGYADGLNDVQLTGLNFGLGLFGSALLAMAVCEGYIDANNAYERSIVDELYQSEKWGEDDENLARLNNNRAQAQALGTLFETLL
ncbi:MAG: ATP12 family protein [Hyphomonadaceae bacterium]